MSTVIASCRICGAGRLHSLVRKNNVEYKGTQAEVDLVYSVCDTCGSEQASGDDLRANKRAVIRFKKTVDGLLTGAEVRSIRNMLKLSQDDAAEIFGGGPKAFSKYENDDVAQSEAMDKMIRLAAQLPTAFEHLTRIAGLSKGKETPKWQTLTGQPLAIAKSGVKPRLVASVVNPEPPKWAAAA